MPKLHLTDTLTAPFSCPVEGCIKTYDRINSLRRHCRRTHGAGLITATALTDAEKKARHALREKKRREKKRREVVKRYHSSGREARSCVKVITEVLTERDADERGVHGCKHPLVECRLSNIPNAGNGVFAMQNFKKGDIVTWYEGKEIPEPTDGYDRSYVVYTSIGYLDGIRTPKKGRGLASFINREERRLGMRTNCRIVVIPESKHRVYVEVSRTIKAGRELYTNYSDARDVRMR